MSRLRSAKAGLTLIEMVVVLVILAALAGVAVQSLEPVADQSRYEATQQTLRNAEQAILSRDIVNGQVSYSGFVADVGRLPLAREVDAAGNITLETVARELWMNDVGIQSFSVARYDDPFTDATTESSHSTTVPVAAGWRGPYLLLPPGTAVLRDAYGRGLSFFSVPSSGTAAWINGSDTISAAARPSIAGFRSFGSDGDLLNLAATAYGADIYMPSEIITASDYLGRIAVTITVDEDPPGTPLPFSGTLIVRVYGPKDGDAYVLANIDLSAAVPNESALPYSGILMESPTIDVEIPCGTRAVRALVIDTLDTSITAPAPMALTTATTGTESVQLASYLRQVVIGPGVNNVDLHLRVP